MAEMECVGQLGIAVDGRGRYIFGQVELSTNGTTSEQSALVSFHQGHVGMWLFYSLCGYSSLKKSGKG